MTIQGQRGRWLRWSGIVFLLLIVVLFGSFFAWRHSASSGLSDQLAAYRAAGEPVTVQELNDWPAVRSGGENAVPLLRAAADAIDEKSDAWKGVNESEDDFVPPLREREVAALEALVKENEEAFRLADEAVRKPGVDWDLRLTSPMINNPYPDLNKQRRLANALRAAAQLEHHRGNDAEALRRVGQILFIGRAMDFQPTYVAHLVSIGIDAMAAYHACEFAPELKITTAPTDAAGAATPQQVRSLIARLLDEKPLAEGQRRSWVGERVMQVDAVESLASGTMAGSRPGVPVRAKLFFMQPYFYDNARVMASHTTSVMQASSTSSDLAGFRRKVPNALPQYLNSPRYMLANTLLPSLDRGAEVQFRVLTDRRLAATCLAVRLYAAEHEGRLPRTLDELVPDYLPAVPLDPLVAEGAKPLGYVNAEKDPEKPRVYGVGPNGKDQGGADPVRQRISHREYEARRDEVRYLKRQPRPEPEPEPEGEAVPYYPGYPRIPLPDSAR